MRGGGGAWGGGGYARLTESFEDTDWSENGAVWVCANSHTWETQISFLTLFDLLQPHENNTPFSFSSVSCFENNTFCYFILHIHQFWQSLPSGWCHFLSLQSLFLPKLLSASIINPFHKLYMYNSFYLSRVFHLWNSRNKMTFFHEFASEKSCELCLVCGVSHWYTPQSLKREVEEESLLRWIIFFFKSI